MLLLAWLACRPTDPDTEPGPAETDVVDTDAVDDTDPVDTDVDDTDVDDTDDTDPPLTWTTLPNTCTPASGRLPDPLTQTGRFEDGQDFPGDPFVELLDVDIVDDVAYAVGQGGFVVLDIGDPTNPTELGRYTGPFNRFHRVVALDDGLVALSHRDQGLDLVDASDPTAPASVARIRAPGLEGLAWTGEYLIATVRDEGVRVYDVVDPKKPLLVATAAGLTAPWSLSTPGADGWLYVADAALGVVPLDVSDPLAPVIGDAVDVGTLLHAERDGDRLYVAGGGAGVKVLDVSLPDLPVWTDSWPTGGSVTQVDAADGLVAAADHEGLLVWDARGTPAVPIGRERTFQFSLGVELDGTQAWAAAWNHFIGLAIDADGRTGDFDPVVRDIRLGDSGVVSVPLPNRGGGPLTLVGATATDPDVVLEVDGAVIPSGGQGWLRITSPPGRTFQICLASDDPDVPVYKAPVSSEDALVPPVGERAPDFALEDRDGITHRLSEQLGNPVLLVYFATW
jgi:hypothetical protein